MPRFVLLAVAALAIAPLDASAQGLPRSFTNLQVLPKTTTGAELIAAMKGFTRALGVRCQFCHVGEEGLPLEQFDFVADSRPQKTTARSMMRMVQQVNATLDAALPNRGTEARVGCWTCHAGQTTPRAAADGPRLEPE